MSVAIEEILNLGVKERLELIEEIWDSIAAHPEAISLTAQRKELDRRKRQHRRNPSKAKSWSEIHSRLEKRKK
jgi:putative addiction module component (TIGR02574 family)